MLGWTSTIVRLPSPEPGFANRVGLTGFFIILVKVSLVPRALPFLIQTFLPEKIPLSATIVVIDIDKTLVNQLNQEIRFNYKFRFL